MQRQFVNKEVLARGELERASESSVKSVLRVDLHCLKFGVCLVEADGRLV